MDSNSNFHSDLPLSLNQSGLKRARTVSPFKPPVDTALSPHDSLSGQSSASSWSPEVPCFTVPPEFSNNLNSQEVFIQKVFQDKVTDIALGTRELLRHLDIPYNPDQTGIKHLISALFKHLNLSEFDFIATNGKLSYLDKILYALRKRSEIGKNLMDEEHDISLGTDRTSPASHSNTPLNVPCHDYVLSGTDFSMDSLPLQVKLKTALQGLNRLLQITPTEGHFNHYGDIRNFFLMKFEISKSRFESDVSQMLEGENRTRWETLVSQTIITDKASRYNTSIKQFLSFQTKINLLAPINHEYTTIHYSGITKYPEVFESRNRLYYHLCNADPFFNGNLLGFNIQIVCNADFIEAIKSFEPFVDTRNEANFILTFNPSSGDTMISQPFCVIDHDKFQTFNFNFPNSSSSKSISFENIRKLLTPKILDSETFGIETLFEVTEMSKPKTSMRIPILIPEDIIPFFMNLNTFNPISFKSLPKDAKIIYSLEITRLGLTLNDALENFKPGDSAAKSVLDVALTQWLVVPTFLLLYPSSKHKKLSPVLARLIRQRVEAIHEALSKGLPHIYVDIEHLFNKPRSITRVSGKNKIAERKIKEGKFSIASNILKTLDTPFTEPHNSAHVLQCLKALTPATTTIDGSEINGHHDLKKFVSSHALEHENSANVPTFFNHSNIRAVLQASSRKNTSPGIDRLHAELLHSLIMDSDCTASTELLNTLVKLFNRLVISPSYIWKYINISSLHGIPKSDNDYRPIANGTQWRKTFGNIILHHFDDPIKAHYGNMQFAGKQLAAEQVTSIARSWFLNSKSYLIKIDIKNAFNSFLRSTALLELIRVIPELGCIVANMFSMPLPLIFQNSGSFDAVFGSQQGCIFGGLLFNFAFQKVLNTMKELFPHSITVAYMDDNLTSLEGSAEEMVEYILAFIKTCDSIGLKLNLKKLCIIIPEDSKNLSAGDFTEKSISSKDLLLSLLKNKGCEIEEKNFFQKSADDSVPVGIEVLGCPIGNTPFILDFLTKFFDEYYDTTQAARKMQSHHCRWSLAKNSIFSKLIYIMRLVPPEFTCKFYKKLEEEDWLIIESILKLGELDHITQKEVEAIIERGKLKITHGGYNLRDYSSLSKAAFLGSQLSVYHELVHFLNACSINLENDIWLGDLALRTHHMEDELPLVFPPRDIHYVAPMTSDLKTLEMLDIESFIDRIATRANRDSSPTNPRKYQAFLSKQLYNSKFKGKYSLNDNHAFKWLCIDPSSTEVPVSNLEYTRMFRDSANIHFVSKDTLRTCICGSSLDSQEKHLKGCNCFGIKDRHNNVVKIISKYLNSMNAKAIPGEIPIEALAPLMPREALGSISEIRPNFVRVNRASLDESLSPSSSASSYSQIKNLVETLVRSDANNDNHVSFNDDHASNSASSSTNYPITECPTPQTNHSGSSNSNSNSLLSSKIIDSTTSTKGTRIDIVTLAPWIRVMMDVTIVNNVNLAENEYLKKFDSAESSKRKLHLQKVQQQGYEYEVPIFSTDGSPSKNTKKALQGHFRKYLSRLSPEQAKIIESYGNKTDHYLNLICFQIHRDNAVHANHFNLKLHLKKNSLSNLSQSSLVSKQYINDIYTDANFYSDLKALHINQTNSRA